MGNTNRIEGSSATESPPFKKAQISHKYPVRMRELTTKEVSVRIKNSSDRVSEFFENIIEKSYDIILEFTKPWSESNSIIRFIAYCAIISTLAHIIYQIVIANKYSYESGAELVGAELMTVFVYVICIFSLINFCLTFPCFCFVRRIKVGLIFYFIALCVYLGYFCSVAHFLRKRNLNQFRFSLVLFFCCVSVHGIVVLLTSVVYLIYGIIYWCNKLILYLTLKCCYNPEEDDSHYTIYLYDSTKTQEKACTICLQEYMESDEIRICKTHLIHIFHESCISSWLSSNSTCPLCGNNLPAKFH